MTELSLWLRCALAALATWRVTHLLAAEDGPADLLFLLRRRLSDTWLGKLTGCFFCLSMWVAAPLAVWISARLPDVVVVWLALSGAACLLERATEAPVVIEPLKGDADGMLRAAGESADRTNVGHATRT